VPQKACEAISNLNNEVIADCVSETVIYHFKTIYIYEEHCKLVFWVAFVV